MKILVVSLQRIGDLLMAANVIYGLRKKHSQARIELLTNKNNSSVVHLFTGLSEVHYLDYNDLQQSLTQADRSLFEGYDSLSSLINTLEDKNYDLVVNLTNNSFAARLVGLLNSKKTIGAHTNEVDITTFGSRWFEYLNEYGSRVGEKTLNCVDVYSEALSLEKEFGLKLDSSNSAKQVQVESPYLLLQVTTSDNKKNLSVEQWRDLIEQIHEVRAEYKTVIVCSKNEEENLKKTFCNIKNDVDVVACDFDTALDYIHNAEGLITVDTSIKHLAASTRTKILEIVLGGSDFYKTGAYSKNVLIVKPNVECQPCVHSVPCTKQLHECSQKVMMEGLANIAVSYFEQNEMNLKVLAEEYSDSMTLYKAAFTASGTWYAYNVYESLNDLNVANWVALESFRIINASSSQNAPLEIGTVSVELKSIFEKNYPERNRYTWLETYKSVEHKSNDIMKRLEKIQTLLRMSYKNLEDTSALNRFEEGLFEISKDYAHWPNLTKTIERLITDAKRSVDLFTKLKKYKAGVDGLTKELHLQNRILISLKTQLLEEV